MIIKYENNRPDKSTFIVYCCILLVSLYNDYVRSFKGGGCLFPCEVRSWEHGRIF